MIQNYAVRWANGSLKTLNYSHDTLHSFADDEHILKLVGKSEKKKTQR